MQEQSGIQTNKPTQSLDSEHGVTPQSSRRKFLTKASVGIVVASLPSKSVWANVGGIAQSIVASGHGSDFVDGKCIQLLSQGIWKKQSATTFPELGKKFQTIFGAGKLPFMKSGVDQIPNPTLLSVIKNPDKYHSNSFQIVTMYLNAFYSGSSIQGQKIYYPIIDTTFGGSSTEFAKHLYLRASTVYDYGDQLGTIITQYHSGKVYGNCVK